MKQLQFILIFFCASLSFAQEVEEEFLPIVVGDKEAFMSTKTGEYVYRAHAETNPEELQTTVSGVVYNDISTHKIVKGETLSSIAKKHNLSIDQLKNDNKLKTSKLSLGQELKIINRVLVTSSSPVISYVGEERIIAKLRPGQSPSTLAPPPPDATPVATSKIEKTASPDTKKPVSRKSTFYKPMIIPTQTSQTEDEVEDSEEEVEVIEVEEDNEEIKAAQKQLEEAQRKLELAKQKAAEEPKAEVLEEVVEEEKVVEEVVEIAEEVEEEEEVEETVIESTETTEEEVEETVVEPTEIKSTEAIKAEAKAKYEAIQEKLNKVKSITEDKEVVEVEEKEIETTTKEVEEVEAKAGVDYHIIVKGDNLYNLARTYKTTIDKLTKLNEVNASNLKIGQKLKLK